MGKSAADIHKESKIKQWKLRAEKASRIIKSLEIELLSGSSAMFLQEVHSLKDKLIEQRADLSKAEKWISHWVNK